MDVLTFFGLVATLTFGSLTVYFYVRSKRYKRLTFTFGQDELQAKRHPDIKITFGERPINNLSRLRVVCWNSGTEEIRLSDIPEDAPPQIVFPEDTRVLSVGAVVSSNGSSVDIREAGAQKIVLKFGYLNPKDFVYFEALYENLEPPRPTIEFAARVIGGAPAASRRFTAAPPPGELTSVVALAAAWIIAAYLTMDPVRRSVQFVDGGARVHLPGIALALIPLALLLVWWRATSKYLRRRREASLPVSAAKKFLE